MSSDLKKRLEAAIAEAHQRARAIDPHLDCDLTFHVCADEIVSDFASEVAFGVFGFEDLCRFLELTPDEVTARWGWDEDTVNEILEESLRGLLDGFQSGPVVEEDEGSGTWGYMEVSVNSQTLSSYIETETETNVLTEFLRAIQRSKSSNQ